jgi:hypothetical protein
MLMKIIRWLQQNKEKVYYGVIIVSFVIAVIYAWRGYHFHQSLPAVKDGNDLTGRVFSPFILAVIRFVVVMLLGIFIAMNIIANPMKRIKMMHFEVEFAEIAKVQEKQLNQFHFLSTALKQNDYFVHKVIGIDHIPFEKTIVEILKKYEEFFDNDLQININAQISEMQPNTDCFSKTEYNRIAKELSEEDEESKKFITRKKFFGDTNFMMGIREEFGSKYVVLIESKEHIFTDYDKEVLKSIFEYGVNICNTVALLD